MFPAPPDHGEETVWLKEKSLPLPPRSIPHNKHWDKYIKMQKKMQEENSLVKLELIHIFNRIYRQAVQSDFIMEVWTRAGTCVTDKADYITAFYPLACLYIKT